MMHINVPNFNYGQRQGNKLRMDDQSQQSTKQSFWSNGGKGKVGVKDLDNFDVESLDLNQLMDMDKKYGIPKIVSGDSDFDRQTTNTKKNA